MWWHCEKEILEYGNTIEITPVKNRLFSIFQPIYVYMLSLGSFQTMTTLQFPPCHVLNYVTTLTMRAADRVAGLGSGHILTA